MGECHLSSYKDDSEDLWLLEDSWSKTSFENQIDSLHKDFDFSPIKDQGISPLEEISKIIEENEFPKPSNLSISNKIFVEQENILCHNNIPTSEFDGSNMFSEASSMAQESDSQGKKLSIRKGFISKTYEKKSKKTESIEANKESLIRVENKSGEREESRVKKKIEHNAKERFRRVKLNSSYQALHSLLPISRASKKKWNAPTIIDEVIDYIPELENEIEKLTRDKNRIVEENNRIETKKNNSLKADHCATTVSLNKVKQGGMIIQICKKRSGRDHDDISKLLQNIEDESIVRILGVSTLLVCDERECYTIHVQMNEGSSSSSCSDNEYDFMTETFLSWLS